MAYTRIQPGTLIWRHGIPYRYICQDWASLVGVEKMVCVLDTPIGQIAGYLFAALNRVRGHISRMDAKRHFLHSGDKYPRFCASWWIGYIFYLATRFGHKLEYDRFWGDTID